jgi:predicted esterase
MEEHFLRVPRTARYVTLGTPGDRLSEVWMVCHGYGQLARRFVEDFEGLADGTRMIVAPEGLSRFYIDRTQQQVMGASWMTREDRLHEIEDYLGYLDALYADVRERIGRDLPVTALGFSQGVATAVRWAARTRAPVRRLVAWGGTLPPEVDLTLFARMRVTVVGGDKDELITTKVRETEAGLWRAVGIDPEVRIFAGHHEVLPEVLSELARS